MYVKELMKSPVVTTEEKAPLRLAMALMAGHGIRHLPVVRGGALVGILTDRDCRKAWASSAPTLTRYELLYLLQELPVSDAMTGEVITVTPETPVLDAARLMQGRKIGCLPVVEGLEVVGILTTTDLLAALARVLEARYPMTPRQVLAPTDFSDLSGRAVQYARHLAEKYAARLILLNVQSPPNLSETEGALPEGVLDRIRTSRELEALARLRETFPDGERTRYRVVTGYPEVEIARVARDEGVDLIVMGTRRRAGLGGLLAGSVTEEVLRRASCPVLALTG